MGRDGIAGRFATPRRILFLAVCGIMGLPRAPWGSCSHGCCHDALINLGMAHYRLGAIEDAKTAMRHVLALSPRHPVAAANLAAFMRLTGEGERAEILLLDLRRGTRITDRGRGATALAATAITGRNN